jgi:hypothetical protein
MNPEIVSSEGLVSVRFVPSWFKRPPAALRIGADGAAPSIAMRFLCLFAAKNSQDHTRRGRRVSSGLE